MATENLTKRQAYIEVDIGNDKTSRVSLGSLDKDAWDADKAIAIVAALEPCLDSSIEAVPMVATYNVTE